MKTCLTHLTKLHVKGRRKGVASHLIQWIVERAKTSKCRAVYLHVINYNHAAIGMYQRNDFQEIACRQNFYYIRYSLMKSNTSWKSAFLWDMDHGLMPCHRCFKNHARKGVFSNSSYIARAYKKLYEMHHELLAMEWSYRPSSLSEVSHHNGKNQIIWKLPTWSHVHLYKAKAQMVSTDFERHEEETPKKSWIQMLFPKGRSLCKAMSEIARLWIFQKEFQWQKLPS